MLRGIIGVILIAAMSVPAVAQVGSEADEAAWWHVRRLSADVAIDVEVKGHASQRVSFVSANEAELVVKSGGAIDTMKRADVLEIRGPVARKKSGFAATAGVVGGLFVGGLLFAKGGAPGWMPLVLPVAFGFAAYHGSKHTVAPLLYRAPKAHEASVVPS
jgi:hypothetical protein